MSGTESTPRPLESGKIAHAHRAKLAVVYVRQSTPQQVAENLESLDRQYALADHARAMGWPAEWVLVIDEDLGQSARTADARLAERSYRAVAPDNRLVARALEQRWEEALRREQELRERYDRFRRESPRRLTSEELDRIRALAADIPSLWHAAETPAVDRKENVRALVERVTVTVAGDSERVLVRIRWMGGTTTEHALRRPISHYERLADFPRIRRLVEAAVAAGRTSGEIAECLNREGFRPPSNRADRFTPERARDLVYRLGLSPRRRPAEGLAVNEWWMRDLADGLGVRFGRFKEWVKRGYVHARRVGSRKHLVIWADAEERERLGRLRDAFRPGQTNPYPAELTRPKARPAQSPGALCARDAALDP